MGGKGVGRLRTANFVGPSNPRAPGALILYDPTLMFGRGKPKYSKAEALGAKPIRVVDAKLQPTDKGGAKVTVKLKNRGWAGVIFRMPEGATKTFEMDEMGVMVWDQCDGKTSVRQIIRKLAGKYGINLREAEVPTLKFLETLVKRGLVGMTLPDRKDVG